MYGLKLGDKLTKSTYRKVGNHRRELVLEFGDYHVRIMGDFVVDVSDRSWQYLIPQDEEDVVDSLRAGKALPPAEPPEDEPTLAIAPVPLDDEIPL